MSHFQDEMERARNTGTYGGNFTPNGKTLAENDKLRNEHNMSRILSPFKPNNRDKAYSSSGTMPEAVFYILQVLAVIMALSFTGSALVTILGALALIGYMVGSVLYKFNKEKSQKREEVIQRKLVYIAQFNYRNGIKDPEFDELMGGALKTNRAKNKIEIKWFSLEVILAMLAVAFLLFLIIFFGFIL